MTYSGHDKRIRKVYKSVLLLLQLIVSFSSSELPHIPPIVRETPHPSEMLLKTSTGTIAWILVLLSLNTLGNPIVSTPTLEIDMDHPVPSSITMYCEMGLHANGSAYLISSNTENTGMRCLPLHGKIFDGDNEFVIAFIPIGN